MNDLAFSPDGTYLAAALAGNKALLVTIGRQTTEFAYELAAVSVAFSPDSRFVVVGVSDEVVRIIETATATEKARAPE